MFALLENMIVREIIAMSREDLEHFYPPEFTARCVACGDEVRQGWTWDGTRFLPPPDISLDEAIVQAHAALQSRRQEAEYGGFVLHGQRWDSEQKDELRLNSIVTMMEKSGMASFDGWKIADGVYITLTPEIAATAALAMMQHYALCFAVETDKRQALAASGAHTAAQVRQWLTDNLDTGWPGEG